MTVTIYRLCADGDMENSLFSTRPVRRAKVMRIDVLNWKKIHIGSKVICVRRECTFYWYI